MARHEHTVGDRTQFQSGDAIEHCECGATRSVERGRQPGPWHACALCQHLWAWDVAS